MKTMLFVNGRFYTQQLSGVQRFAIEITSALGQQCPERIVVLAPGGSEMKNSAAQIVGRRAGHFWEQIELPNFARTGMLLNFGNTAPLRLTNQILVIHDAGVFATPEAYDWKFRAWYKFLQGYLVRAGVGIVTVSEFSRRELIKYLGVESEDVRVISEGADHMSAVSSDPRVLAQIPTRRFVLVVGNLAAHKNLGVLAQLAIQLAMQNVTLVITGGLATNAFQKAKLNALPQSACFVGRVSDGELKALYENAACLVFPSRYEGFGLPAIEAMACGCPVVASRIPALQETCGEAALYSECSSPSSFVDQVYRLLGQPELESAMRAAAIERARNFTWKRAASQLVEAVDFFLTRQRR